MSEDETRDLEFDLQALSGRLRDDCFADEMYRALCNTDWTHIDGTAWHGSWRYSAGLIATFAGPRRGLLRLLLHTSVRGGDDL